MYQERYELIKMRILRNDLFAPSTLFNSSNNRLKVSLLIF